jgi:hypothetical protein
VSTWQRPHREPGQAEDTAGVERIDELLAERDAIVQRLKHSRPLYGPLGLWSHLRKVELSRIKVRLLAEAAGRGEKKPTDEVLDATAHADPVYVDLITSATTTAAQWVADEEALAAIDMKVNRGQAVLRYAASEPRT